jgi:hypothetical protein
METHAPKTLKKKREKGKKHLSNFDSGMESCLALNYKILEARWST